MLALILTSLLSLPIYPLNPIEQDTLPTSSFNLSTGVCSPGSVLSAGLELGSKYEILIRHPYIVRAGIDYKYSSINSSLFPSGDVHSFSPSLEAFMYRGTRKVTGYMGFGLAYSTFYFKEGQNTLDSLNDTDTTYNITDIKLKDKLGYRLILGVRFNHTYTLELGITEVRPYFIYVNKTGNYSYSEIKNKARISDIRITFGYIIPI